MSSNSIMLPPDDNQLGQLVDNLEDTCNTALDHFRQALEATDRQDGEAAHAMRHADIYMRRLDDQMRQLTPVLNAAAALTKRAIEQRDEALAERDRLAELANLNEAELDTQFNMGYDAGMGDSKTSVEDLAAHLAQAHGVIEQWQEWAASMGFEVEGGNE